MKTIKTIAADKSGAIKPVLQNRDPVVLYAGRGFTEYRMPNGAVMVEVDRPRVKRRDEE